MRFGTVTDQSQLGIFRFCSAILLLGGIVFVPFLNAEDDPAARWVSAYAWIQTGDRLAEAQLWPLAIGSYMESHRQITSLAADHPSYEPEVVGYRLEKLESDINSAQENLVHGEHDIMMKYLDFIESFELGLKQRFAGKFPEALTTLDFADTLLDEIVGEKPDEFLEAVSSQQLILLENRDWLDQQVNFEARSRAAIQVPGSTELGTTKFVKESDLPDSLEGSEPNGALFPGVVAPPESTAEERLAAFAPAEPSSEPSGKEKGETPETFRFRMSSKSESTEKDDDTATAE